jgi:hypothetical protein
MTEIYPSQMPPAYVDEEQVHIEKTSKTEPALKPQFISKVDEIVDSDLPPTHRLWTRAMILPKRTNSRPR